MHITYQQLADMVSTWTPEQRNSDVTFFDGNEGEFGAITSVEFADPEEDDVLDPGHPYLRGFE
jgi:hypothetical protein